MRRSKLDRQPILQTHTPYYRIAWPSELELCDLRLWPDSTTVVGVNSSKVDVKHVPQKRLLRKTIARKIESRIGASGAMALQKIIVWLRFDD
jgi:hypothetical protein